MSYCMLLVCNKLFNLCVIYWFMHNAIVWSKKHFNALSTHFNQTSPTPFSPTHPRHGQPWAEAACGVGHLVAEPAAAAAWRGGVHGLGGLASCGGIVARKRERERERRLTLCVTLCHMAPSSGGRAPGHAGGGGGGGGRGRRHVIAFKRSGWIGHQLGRRAGIIEVFTEVSLKTLQRHSAQKRYSQHFLLCLITTSHYIVFSHPGFIFCNEQTHAWVYCFTLRLLKWFVWLLHRKSTSKWQSIQSYTWQNQYG